MEQPGESRIESFLLDSAVRGRRTRRRWPQVLLGVFLLLVLLGFWWSVEPDAPVLTDLPETRGKSVIAPGVATTAMLKAELEILLDKSGGYLGNDALPPGVWLDNMPSFERGALFAARDMTLALRRDFSHLADESLEDPDLQRAEARFAFGETSSLAVESEYREGIASLDSYLARLMQVPQPGAHFHPRADALGRWLADVDARLAAYVDALDRAAADTGGNDARASAVPVGEVDDVFYEARGYAWALRAQMSAIDVDFAVVLHETGAGEPMLRTAAELAGTQKPVRSPVILNGSEYGVLANHVLVMAGYLARTRADIEMARARLSATSITSAQP